MFYGAKSVIYLVVAPLAVPFLMCPPSSTKQGHSAMEKSGESNSNSPNQLGHQWDDLTKMKWEDRQQPQDLDSLLKSDETGDLDVNKLSDKIGRRQLVKQYAERVLYESKNGEDIYFDDDPFALAQFAETPHELCFVGDACMDLAEHWKFGTSRNLIDRGYVLGTKEESPELHALIEKVISSGTTNNNRDNGKSNDYDDIGEFNKNTTKGNVKREIANQYAERVVYVNERGREETILLNPWEMLKYVESPDELYIVGLEFIKVSSNMAKNEEILDSRNHGKLQLRKGNDESGYQPMMPERVIDDSELGKFLGKISKDIEDRINKGANS